MPRARTTPRLAGVRGRAVALACASAACVAAGAAPSAAAGAGGGPDSPFWTEPTPRAAKQSLVWQERGREEDAAVMRRIAEQPTAVWMPGDDPRAEVARVTEEAERAGRIPVLVAYNIPHRDCGQYSSGGARDAAAYRDWVARAADGIGEHRAWVVLEPDAIAQWATCLPQEAKQERLELLAHAVRAFKARRGASVYIDAGNAGWISDQGLLAEALRRAGVGEADGFALNVSNFHTTQVTRAYGDELSGRLDGAHYIIDTSRNGNGPLPPPPPGSGDDESWCNPPGRALGTPPTTATGDARVDAFVWVKRPGESDGSCRGAPPAGRWWPEYALGLAGGQPLLRPRPEAPTPAPPLPPLPPPPPPPPATPPPPG
ncbi:glycoside hydrolase family 6 protein [Streptomyces alboverticillatus]|uniref:glycoside hydrolase family 6 protein n=1 Tax=Streptomyces alboverticillatus TaxID=173770 RepID=UPI000A3CAACA|nr:glycoside hydrolase family 6 protein [Streptomyces alboverticillatus]